MELNNTIKFEKNWKILRRLKAINFLIDWMKHRQVCEKLDISTDSLTRRTKLLCSWWLESLINLQYDWRRISEYEEYKEEILLMVDDNIYWDYREFHNAVHEKFTELKTKQDAFRKFCKKNEIWVIRNVI